MTSVAEDKLKEIFDRESNIPICYQDELSYRQMLFLAESYTGWAMDKRVTPEQSAMLLGRAKGMEDLAWIVGTDWSPPEPPRLSFIGFIAREVEKSILGEE